jgi:hypothetical protein
VGIIDSINQSLFKNPEKMGKKFYYYGNRALIQEIKKPKRVEA